MKSGAPSFGAQLKALREAAGFTQEELATIAGLSVHAVSALERGQRRRPHVDTLRALSSALDLSATARDALFDSARGTTSTLSSPALNTPSLPLAPSPLLGREKEVGALQHLLADSSVRLITLVGPGGVGKTRLLTELAHLLTATASTRVVFVSLAALCEPSLVAPAVAEALGLSDVSALDLPQRALLACGGFPTLLALDNFEHVLAAAPLVSDLLSTVGSLRVIATSREPLRLRGERKYLVEPLALAEDWDGMSPDEVSANCAAVRLFVSRVEDVQPAFRLTAANVSVVSAICRRLDALPLAIELAAPWMKVLTAEDLLRRLERNVLLSAIGTRDLPERQQTMNATVAWSYQLLSADEQRVFRCLGVLPNTFSIDAAAAVVGGREGSTSIDDVLPAVAALIQRSLLRRADSALAGPSYQMLETVRAFAALELTASAERDDAREGLARYCVREGRRAADGLVGPAQAEWLTRVRGDLESYRQTLAWLVEQGRGAEAADIAWGLLFFWLIRGHVVEGVQWYSQVLALPSTSPAADAQARLGLATLLFVQGHYDRAAVVIAPARAFFEANAETELSCRASDLSARIQQGLGDLDAARNSFNHAITGFQALGLPWGAGNALLGLGGIALEVGDLDQAEHLMDEAASALQSTGPWFLTRARFIRAVVWLRRGNPAEAIALLREGVASIRDLHDAVGLVHALVAFASAAALKGDHAWAARILGARDVVSERTGVTVVVKHVRFLREKIEHDVRERLGPTGWDSAYAAGRRLSLDLLLKEIHRIP